MRVCLSGALRLEDDAQTSSKLRSNYAAKMFEGSPGAQEDLTVAQWEKIAGILADAGIPTDATALQAVGAQIRKSAEEEGM